MSGRGRRWGCGQEAAARWRPGGGWGGAAPPWGSSAAACAWGARCRRARSCTRTSSARSAGGGRRGRLRRGMMARAAAARRAAAASAEGGAGAAGTPSGGPGPRAGARIRCQPSPPAGSAGRPGRSRPAGRRRASSPAPGAVRGSGNAPVRGCVAASGAPGAGRGANHAARLTLASRPTMCTLPLPISPISAWSRGGGGRRCAGRGDGLVLRGLAGSRCLWQRGCAAGWWRRRRSSRYGLMAAAQQPGLLIRAAPARQVGSCSERKAARPPPPAVAQPARPAPARQRPHRAARVPPPSPSAPLPQPLPARSPPPPTAALPAQLHSVPRTALPGSQRSARRHRGHLFNTERRDGDRDRGSVRLARRRRRGHLQPPRSGHSVDAHQDAASARVRAVPDHRPHRAQGQGVSPPRRRLPRRGAAPRRRVTLLPGCGRLPARRPSRAGVPPTPCALHCTAGRTARGAGSPPCPRASTTSARTSGGRRPSR